MPSLSASPAREKGKKSPEKVVPLICRGLPEERWQPDPVEPISTAGDQRWTGIGLKATGKK